MRVRNTTMTGTIVSLIVGVQAVSYAGAPTYELTSNITLRGTKRTFAQHDAIYARRPFPYELRYRKGEGSLLFVGATHTFDPADPQLRKLESLWKEVKPTVALVEGQVTGYSGSYEDLAKRGENFFTFGLARKNGIDVFSLEPDRKSEGAALKAAESAERALLFLTVRGYFSRRRTQPEIPDSVVQLMLTRRAQEYGLACELKTIADLDAMWKRDFPNELDWRKADESVAWPGRGGRYLNRLSNMSNDVRDAHWVRVMLDLTAKGHRVFAVGGASHAINLEPVLSATFTSSKRLGWSTARTPS